MATLYKRHTVVPGTFVSDFVPNWPYVCYIDPLNLANYPSWFNAVEWMGYWFTGYSFTAPLTLGTYQFIFGCQLSSPIQTTFATYLIEVVVVADIIARPVEICCQKKEHNIAWFNKEGGWRNWIFDGVRTSKLKMSNDNTFKELDDDGDLTTKYSERSEIFDAEICSAIVTCSQLEYLDSLRESIQAYKYNSEDDSFNIAVLLDSKSVTKYKSKDKFFEVKISFIYAKEKLIQTQ